VAFCPPQLLEDLADVFADLQTWAGVIEKRPGVFYAHGQPFLHFHLVAGARRRADVKGRTTWTQLDLPSPVNATSRRALARELRIRYGEKAKEQAPARPRSPNSTRQRIRPRHARPGR
jgi:hypothetical protein